MSVIEFAEKRLNDESRLPDGGALSAQYWAAYLDGARAQAKEDAEQIKELNRYKELGTVEELDRALCSATL